MTPSHHNIGRQAPASAIHIGRINRVALSREQTARIIRQVTAIDSVVLPEVPDFDGPVEIHMDTGFEYLPGSVDTGEGC